MSKIKPFQNEFRPKLIRHLINQVSKGESSALIGLPGVGKTNAIHWLKKRSQEHKVVILVHVDLNNLVSSQDLAYYRLLLLELHRTISTEIQHKDVIQLVDKIYQQNISSNDDLLTFDAVKRIIEEVFDKTEKSICILFDSFEKLINVNRSVLNSLIALRSLDKTRIAYLFVGNRDLDMIFPAEKTGDINVLLNYNKHWLRLLNKEETFKLIDEFSELLDSKLENEQKEKIWKMSGGHAWYIKVLSKIHNENELETDITEKDISALTSIRSRASQLWTALTKDYQTILQKLITNPKSLPKDIPEFLTATGLIQIDEGSVKFFSPLFEQFVEKKASKNGFSDNNKYPTAGTKTGLSIDYKKRVVLKNGKAISGTFTRNEFNLLKYFFENESLALTRDDIAEIIWGKDATQKYSDWAIDKVVSRIRDKIEDNSRKPKFLLTMRGVGFKFNSSGEENL